MKVQTLKEINGELLPVIEEISDEEFAEYFNYVEECKGKAKK